MAQIVERHLRQLATLAGSYSMFFAFCREETQQGSPGQQTSKMYYKLIPGPADHHTPHHTAHASTRQISLRVHERSRVRRTTHTETVGGGWRLCLGTKHQQVFVNRKCTKRAEHTLLPKQQDCPVVRVRLCTILLQLCCIDWVWGVGLGAAWSTM